MIRKFSRIQVATAIAIIFHTVGFVGIAIFKSELIILSTPINLLLSFALLLWTHPDKNRNFWIFLAVTAVTGFAVEVIGINKGWLFGSYRYGSVLGPQWLNVPFMIGINWCITMYCCGTATKMLLLKMIKPFADSPAAPPMVLKSISVVVDAATLAVLFDWLMEPVAVKLGFWTWLGDGSIPLFNYICWFVISLALLALFEWLKVAKQNKFAVNLLLIQVMFFLLLRTFLN